MGCYLYVYRTYGNVLCATLVYVVTFMIEYSHFHTISSSKIHKIEIGQRIFRGAGAAPPVLSRPRGARPWLHAGCPPPSGA